MDDAAMMLTAIKLDDDDDAISRGTYVGAHKLPTANPKPPVRKLEAPIRSFSLRLRQPESAFAQHSAGCDKRPTGLGDSDGVPRGDQAPSAETDGCRFGKWESSSVP